MNARGSRGSREGGFLATTVLALICSAQVGAQEKADPVREEYASKLRTLRITLDFQTAPLEDVAGYLREISGLNILVDTAVKEKGDLAVSIKVSDIPLGSVLSLMLRPNGLTHVFKDGVLLITTVERAQQDVVMEIYDVRDLLYPIHDFPGVDFSLAPDSIGGAFGAPDPDTTAAEMPIVDLVKAHTGGRSWDDNPKAAANLQNGLLVVRQTREVHAQVRRLIGKLRRFK